MTEAFQQNHGCIIGIDFGTTYSGCSICYLDNDKSINSQEIETAELEIDYREIDAKIKNLKKETLNIEDSQPKRGKKTPTVAIYDRRSMELLHWGNAALDYIKKMKGNEILLRKFKLNLPTTFSQRGAKQMFKNKRENITAWSLIATIDYYKLLFAHAYDKIQFANSFLGINFSKDSIRFVITVPAVWNDTQRAIMRDIAYQAGLITQFDDDKKLQIINESLASTLYCEQELNDKVIFQEGDIYITCDAGGGTVDIAAFVVTKSHKSGLSRCQISAESGDKCGSTYIDKAMEELLMNVLYDTESDCLSEEDESYAYNSVAKLMEQFTAEEGSLKFNFGKGMKSDFEDYDDNASDDSETSGSEEEDEDEDKHCPDVVFNITSCYPKISWREKDGCVITEDSEEPGYKWLHIPFQKIAKEVFDDVINKTIQLLDMQIEKIQSKNEIKATFLVGGLGNNPYLNYRIREHFSKGMSKGKSRCGTIINDKDGDLATMRGAVYYGIEAAFGAPEANIATSNNHEDQLYSVPGELDVLVCYGKSLHAQVLAYKLMQFELEDIGYDSTSCLITDRSKDADIAPLKSQSLNTKQLLEGENTITVKLASNMQYSEILSLAKADLRALLVTHLKNLLQYTVQYMDTAKRCTDQERYRYCLTLENSYGFFNSDNEMNEIAIEAGLVGEDDDAKNRLLLIKREDAAALYLENQYFGDNTETQNPKSVSTFLQIQVNSDNCQLSLYESTKVTDNSNEQHPRNVRCIRKTTFDFSFLHATVMALQQYSDNDDDCFKCDSGIHTKNLLKFDGSALKKSLARNDMENMEFSITSMWKIKATGQECCQITISGFYFLQDILRPVIGKLASAIASNAVQADIMEFRLDQIFLIGKLLQLPSRSYSYIESSFTQRLSECMNIGRDLIVRADESDQYVVKGALLYSLMPSIFTERIARRTYMVSFEAFTPKYMEGLSHKELSGNQDKRYNTESKHVIAGDKAVDIYYQPVQSPSSKISVLPKDPWVIISRSDKITLDMEASGIQKKFFTEEDAVVYVSIYFSEATETEIGNHSTSNLQMIHQFEVYLKRQVNEDPDDFGVFSDERLHFNICTTPLKDEFKFEITLDVKIGTKIPEFRYRDDFFVANLNHNKDHIAV